MKPKLFILWLMLLVGAAGARAAEAYTYFDPSDGSLNFCYDNSRTSRKNSGYSTYSLNTGSNVPAWDGISSSVKELYFYSNFANYRPTTCYRWAYNMTNLTKVTNISNLNTSSVTNMDMMFCWCKNLANLDVSGFNTSNVTSMQSMFENDGKLTALAVDNWNTAKVKNMGGVFYGCQGLTSLNVANWNTSSVTSMRYLFFNCSSLKSLDLHKWRTTLVTSYYYMFGDCNNLESISGLSSLYAGTQYFVMNSNVTTVAGMFKNCNKLKLLILTNLKFGSSTTTTDMLQNCYALQYLQLSDAMVNYLDASACTGVGTASSPCSLEYSTNMHPSFTTITPDYVVWKTGYFKSNNIKPYAVCYNNTLTFYYDDYSSSRSGSVYNLNTGSNAPAWHSYASGVTTVVFNSTFASARPTSCYEWFDGMTNLISITNMSSYLNTSQVTNMAYMFYNCKKLASVALSGFNTASVTSMRSMFYNCNNLPSIDVSKFNTAKVTDMEYMFYGCSKLPSLNIGNFNLSSLTASTQMMRDCSGLKTLTIPSTANKLDNTACVSVGSKFAPCLLDFPSGFTPEKQDQADNNAISQWYQWKSGFFLDVWSYAELTNSGKTLTFYHDKKWNNRTGTIYSINVADNSWSYSEAPTWNNPTISKNITSVVFDSSFANARPTSCVCWFEGMSNLTSISGMASYLNTSRSSSMYRMFKGCSKLTSIDIKNFNTERTAFFDEMFYGCSSLTSLDLSNFKFVLYFEEESQNMLKDCVALKTLTVNKTAGEMAPNACSGVGTKTSPCELIYPSGFTPEKTATGSGWYQWKSGYFKDAPKYPLGDVNHDGSVSIVDASLITEYVLGKTPVVFFIENADVNNDGNVTVTDVSKIIEMVLNNSAASAPATAREAAFDRLWLTANGNHCLLHLDTPEQYNAMHLTLRLPEGGTMGNVRVSSTRSAGHHAEMRPMGGGLYNIVLHASDNAVLRSNDTALLHFDLAGCQPRDVEVVAVQSSNSIFETVMSAGTTTDIQVVETTDDTDGDAYNAAGVRVTKNTRGVVVKNGMKKIK